MTSLRAPLMTAAALALLSACVPVTGPSGATGPRLEPAETAYVARADMNFTVPAVPLDKVPETYRRQVVQYPNEEVPGTIVIHPGQRLLYFVTGPNTAIRYGISVGRAGFEWAGEAQVSQTRAWPTWTPPPEMIARDPKLAKWEKGQPGGPTNPLGARAIYLLSNGRDYGYRIHGTPEWWSIGRNASSGCIRMINQDVMDLAQRVTPGSKVIVLKADGSRATRLIVPPPAPRKPPAAAVAPTPATVEPVLPPLPVPPPLDPELTGAPA